MHIVYLWHKGQSRHIYIVYWYLPPSFNHRARPGLIASTPSHIPDTHGHLACVPAARSESHIRSPEPVSKAGVMVASLPHEGKSGERISDLYSLWILEGP